MTSVPSYQRFHPEKGTMETVENYDAKRNTVGDNKAVNQLAQDQAIPAVPGLSRSTQTQAKSVPQPASMKPISPAELPIRKFSTLSTEQKSAAIEHLHNTGSYDTLHYLAPHIVGDYANADDHGKIFTKLIDRMPQEHLHELYTGINSYQDSFKKTNKLPNNEILHPSLDGARKSVLGGFGHAKVRIADKIDLNGLKRMQEETNPYVQAVINRRLTQEYINDPLTHEQTRSALKQFSDDHDLLSLNNGDDNAKQALGSVLQSHGLEKLNSNFASEYEDNPHSIGIDMMKQGVNHIFHDKHYVPSEADHIKSSRFSPLEPMESVPPRLATYTHLLAAAARAHHNDQGIKSLTLYRGMTYPKNHSTVRRLELGGEHSLPQEAISKWYDSPEKVKIKTLHPDEKTVVVKSEVPVHNLLSTYKENPALAHEEGAHLVMSPSSRNVKLHQVITPDSMKFAP